MKRIFYWMVFLLILLPDGTDAQQQYRQIAAWKQIAEGEIDLVNNQLEMTDLSAAIREEGNWTGQEYQPLSGIGAVTLEQGELVIRYTPPTSADFPWPAYYQVELNVSINGAPLDPAPAPEYQIGTGRIAAAGNSPRKIILSHLLQQYVQLVGQLKVELRVEALIDCRGLMDDLPPPQFRKTPYLITGGLGAGMLVAGGVLWADSQRRYDDYLDAGDAQSAEPLYEKANRRRHASLVLLFGGAAVLTGDVIAYFVRKGKLRRQQREELRQFCYSPLPGVELQPELELPSISIPNGSLGIKLTYVWGN